MQNYDKPSAQRNTFRAGDAGPTGGNQSQGKGEIPGKVSVPMPGTNATQPAYKGGMKGNIPGFQGGEIPGKV
jgi:hypothetical protein